MNSTFLYIAITIITAAILPGIRWILMKFNNIELELQKKLEEQDVRQLLDDKVDHVTEDLKELKEKIDKIFEHLLNNKRY